MPSPSELKTIGDDSCSTLEEEEEFNLTSKDNVINEPMTSLSTDKHFVTLNLCSYSLMMRVQRRNMKYQFNILWFDTTGTRAHEPLHSKPETYPLHHGRGIC